MSRSIHRRLGGGRTILGEVSCRDGEARHGGRRAGLWPVQLRYPINHTSTQYVSQSLWQEARLERCPLHPGGGCSFARHGTYARKSPPGTRIARWYCPQGHCTFSLLPDCFAARLPGTLAQVEAAVMAAEAAGSREQAADSVRPEIELAGALRWLRRRLVAVYAALGLVRGLMADRFCGCAPTLAGFRPCLGDVPLLVGLREVAAVHLAVLPPPLGFASPGSGGGEPEKGFQQRVGPDPPPRGA